MNIEIALTIDIVLLVSALWCILRVSERSIFNPSLWWVTLHAYTVTFRLITLSLGVQSSSIIGIRSDSELVDAAIASDISLIAVVAATIFVADRAIKDMSWNPRVGGWAQLNPRVGQIISILCLTIGTYALLKFGYTAIAARARGVEISSIDIGLFEQSSYPIMIAGFAVQGALLQVAIRGFTRWRVALLLILLALSSINLARTVFVLAAAMAFLIYQTRSNKTNIPLRWAISFALLGFAWFLYKPFRAAIVEDANIPQIISSAHDYFLDTLGERGSLDTQFFDMQATYMAAAEEEDRRFYGTTLLPLLYLPIPRFVWPDKPRTNEYALELSSPLRPLTKVGMVATLSGESYLNFGWIGCAIIPFLYLVGMHIGYRRVRDQGITSIARMIFLVFLISMVQVFRDGLVSLIIYPVVVYLPMLAWGVISELLAAGVVLKKPVNRPFATQ